MISSLKKAIHDHRSTLTTTATAAATVYVLRTYVKARLEEVKDRLEQERLAKDVLKRRFDQSREDVEYTVMALLPELSQGILGDLDVEAVIQELQTMRAGGRAAEQSPPQRPPSSLASSIDLETRSDTGLSTSGLQGWVEAGQAGNGGDYSPEGSSQLSNSFVTTLSGTFSESEPSTSSSASVVGDASDREQDTHLRPPPPLPAIADLSSSITSLASSSSASSSSSRSKAQLWSTLKNLTFTRTLTTIYAVTLLTLFTSIQLTILAREKYVRGVLQMAKEEKMREDFEAQINREMSFTGMFFNVVKGAIGFGSQTNPFEGFPDIDQDFEHTNLPSISTISDHAFDSLSTKYLTLSYQLLHIGFRDLSARVQSAVEEVLYPVSLKTRLSLTDVHRLVGDIRRRVEWEITFEGRERKVTFEDACVPQTREMVERALRLGGWAEPGSNSPPFEETLSSDEAESSQLSHSFESRSFPPDYLLNSPTPPPPRQEDTHFTSLLEETRAILTSSDFAHVLDICLDDAVGSLMESLESGVFAPPAEDASFLTAEPTRVRLASLLPPLANWSKDTLVGLPCELVDRLIGSSGSGGIREVTGLMALIFGRFENNINI
ncbi:peroxin [Paramarasmius palmivorus]|uniref:Peroxin n=1 Tax=Paramarasmius palmivorus TaxID=297713 RepID=A0AAW0DYB5_9AGAR